MSSFLASILSWVLHVDRLVYIPVVPSERISSTKKVLARPQPKAANCNMALAGMAHATPMGLGCSVFEGSHCREPSLWSASWRTYGHLAMITYSGSL